MLSTLFITFQFSVQLDDYYLRCMSVLRRILGKVLDRVLEQLNARFAQPCISTRAASSYPMLYTAANRALKSRVFTLPVKELEAIFER